MSVFDPARRNVLAGMMALFAACASRDVPAHYPKASAASPEAASAKPADVVETLAPAEHGGAHESAAPLPAADEGHGGHQGHHESH